MFLFFAIDNWQYLESKIDAKVVEITGIIAIVDTFVWLKLFKRSESIPTNFGLGIDLADINVFLSVCGKAQRCINIQVLSFIAFKITSKKKRN